MKERIIESFDGNKIYCYLWDNVKNPVGVVQIFHGMAEHATRYDEFAKFLNNLRNENNLNYVDEIYNLANNIKLPSTTKIITSASSIANSA